MRHPFEQQEHQPTNMCIENIPPPPSLLSLTLHTQTETGPKPHLCGVGLPYICIAHQAHLWRYSIVIELGAFMQQTCSSTDIENISLFSLRLVKKKTYEWNCMGLNPNMLAVLFLHEQNL